MNPSNQCNDETGEIIAILRDVLQTMRFGSVELVIHDGRVVQIDRKEKLRIPPSAEDKRLQGNRGR